MERTLGGFGAFNPADRKSLDTVPTVTRPPGHHAGTSAALSCSPRSICEVSSTGLLEMLTN
jgi:hypothetical protein